MSSYAGYQVVRELRRSPVGFDGLAHRPDAPTSEFLVEVRVPDPIAAGGDERLGIEQFLRQARVQQSISSGAWVRVLEVGESGEEGFAVKDFYARSVRTLIEARARLEAGQTRLLVLGMLDGLIALRDQCGGRAHGELEASRVLIDESPGPGRWRGLLNAPGDDADGRVRGKPARLEDLRGLARIIVGLVELRVPSGLPGSVGPNERWKQAFGDQVDAWVSVVNALLDISLDPDALPLEEVRRRVEAIVAPVRRSKRGLVIAGVVGLALLGGGGYFGVRALGGGSRVEVRHYDFAPSHWVEWNITSRLRTELRDLIKQESEQTSAGTAWTAWLQELRQAADKSPGGQQPDRLVTDAAQLVALLDPDANPDPKVARRNRDQQQEAGASADAYKTWENEVVAVLARAPGKDSLGQVAAWLGEDSAVGAELARSGAEWEDWATPWTTPEGFGQPKDEMGFAEELKALQGQAEGRAARVKTFLDRVRLAAAAEEVNTEVKAIEQPLARIAQAGETNDDAILREAREIVRRFVLPETSEDVKTALSGVSERLSTQVKDVVGAVAGTLDGTYVQTHKTSLREALAGVDLEDGTLDPLRRWFMLVDGKTLAELTGERDPLAAWRGGKQPAQRAEFPAQMTQLEQLLGQDGVTEEQRQAAAEESERARRLMEEADAQVRAALELAPIAANQQKLREAADAAGTRVADASRLMGDRIRDLSVTKDKLRALFAQGNVFADEQVDGRHDEIRAQFSTRLEATPDDALPRLNETYKQVRSQLEAIERRHAVRLETGPWAGKMPLETLESSFAQLRSKRLAAALASVSIEGAATAADATPDPVLTRVRTAIEEAVGRVAALLGRLDAWQSPSAMSDELAEVEGFSVQNVPGLEADDAEAMRTAFATASSELLGRVRAAERVSGSPDELVGIVRQGLSNKPELRMAAYDALSRADGWPRTVEHLGAEVEARDALVESIGAAGVPGDALVSRVEGESARRWHAALAGAGDEVRFSAVMAMRGRFKDTEQLLSDADRRNMALLELKSALGGVDAGDEERADAQTRQIVQAWATSNAGLFGGQAGWIAGLMAALEENAAGASGGMFEAGSAGPAAVGAGTFKGADEEFSYLDYSIAGKDVRLERVGEFESGAASEAGQMFVWYLQTEEVSYDLFSAAAAAVPQWQSEPWYGKVRASGGPSIWQREGRRPGSMTRTWLDVNEDIANKKMLYAQGDPSDLYLLSAAEQNPSASMPMQQVDYGTARDFAAGIGLRLPTLAVWRAAAGPVLANLTPGGAQAAGLNLRDATWGVQADYDQQNNFGQGLLNWRSDWFGSVGAQPTDYLQRWAELNDGYLYFAPTNRRAGVGGFADLVGNVAEFVTERDDGGNVLVVGGSAMSSPPTNAGNLEVAMRPRDRGLGYPDVGFRLAMRVPKDAFITTALQRVNRHLRTAPFSWAAGNP